MHSLIKKYQIKSNVTSLLAWCYFRLSWKNPVAIKLGKATATHGQQSCVLRYKCMYVNISDTPTK